MDTAMRRHFTHVLTTDKNDIYIELNIEYGLLSRNEL